MMELLASPLVASEEFVLAFLGQELTNRGFTMLLRSYREMGHRVGALQFDRILLMGEHGCLLDLLCLGGSVEEAEAEAGLGGQALAVLGKHGVIKCTGGRVQTAGFRLVEHLGCLLFVGNREVARELYFGQDSTALGSWLLGAPGGACLDLCCGVGTQTVLCARGGGERAVGVDANGEALRMAYLNAALNGVSGRVSFWRGDVLRWLGGGGGDELGEVGGFRTVCANPPLLPAPAESPLPLIADGGEDGLTFAAGILQRLPALMEPWGRCYVIGTVLGTESGPDFERLAEIAKRQGLRVFAVVPAAQDVRRGALFRTLLETTAIYHRGVGVEPLDGEGVSAAWDRVSARGVRLYSFCMVASHGMGQAGFRFTRHYERNEAFWQV